MKYSPLKAFIQQGVFNLAVPLVFWFFASSAFAAGTLTPKGSPDAPIQIRDHHVSVVVTNGFARTEVTQTFFNPNPTDLEGVYSFPVPESGALSEYSIYAGETEINGEVVPKKKANEIYEEEKSKGNDAGVANKETYQNFEFRVARIPAQNETRIRFVYYQPLKVDTGIGRYVYPLEDGGTDEVAKSFWTANTKVENSFSADFDVRMAFPIEDLRVPGFEAATTLEDLAPGHKKASIATAGGSLTKDLVLYYRLAQDLPGRVELIPYKASKDKPGSFMMVVTPAMDLQPVVSGADWVFVLDISGSMAGKIHTLAAGVRKALGEMKPEDRVRIVAFESRAHEITRGWVSATPENVQKLIQDVEALKSTGGTNLYSGLDIGLNSLDNDRVTSVILVTDAVTNTGIVDPREFEKMLSQYDVRLFGFLLGNSANWPLMRIITETTGGFYAGVSNSDDIIGQIMLAKSKITHESLHSAKLSIRGVKTSHVTDKALGKVYRGQQLVVFGRYNSGGTAKVKLKAALSGQDKVYETTVELPDVATDFPEVERLWALNQIEEIEKLSQLGKTTEGEAKQSIEDLGVQYQLVTDETSMLVLSDEAFARHGVERKNQARVALERQAQAQRYARQPANSRVDSQKPMFGGRKAPHISLGGGGAIDPLGALFALIFSGALARRKFSASQKEEQ